MNATAPVKVELPALTRGIRKALAQTSASKTEVAIAVGVSYTSLGNWISGRKFPTPDNLRRLARVLGVSEAWLLNGGEDDEHDAIVRAAGLDPMPRSLS